MSFNLIFKMYFKPVTDKFYAQFCITIAL